MGHLIAIYCFSINFKIYLSKEEQNSSFNYIYSVRCLLFIEYKFIEITCY